MPYIHTDKRKRALVQPVTAGELNYALTHLVLTYLVTKGECYQAYNDILGALEGCKLELYRRKVSKYEDAKIKENSDVY